MLVSIVKSSVRCKKCNLRLILENYAQHHKCYKGPVACEWCPKCYNNICDLMIHVSSVHEERRHIFEQKYGHSEDLIELDEVITNVCNNCGECFGTEENLKEHVPKCEILEDSNEIVPCKVEPIFDEESETEQTTATVNETVPNKCYTCVFCHNYFNNLESIVQHIKSEHAETDVAMVPCSVCGVVIMKTITLFEHLDAHLNAKSDEYKGVYHECGTCFKKFFEYEALNVHLRLHKTKKMICPLCPRRFKEEISLKQHLMYHNEIAYCCPKCDKTFNSYSSMVYHQGKHNTPESRYCIRCNRNFTSPESFQKHIKLHGKSKPHLVPEKPSQTDKPKSEPKPFGCSICSRCFKTVHALKVHIALHRKDHPWRCKECKSWFKTEKELEDHGPCKAETKNICAECGKSMSSQGNLKRHITKIHLRQRVEK